VCAVGAGGRLGGAGLVGEGAGEGFAAKVGFVGEGEGGGVGFTGEVLGVEGCDAAAGGRPPGHRLIFSPTVEYA